MIPAVFDGASLANFHQHGFIVPGSKSNLDLLPNLHGYAAPVNIHPLSSVSDSYSMIWNSYYLTACIGIGDVEHLPMAICALSCLPIV